MADDKKAKCGEVPITYPADCSYVCYCTPNGGCTWAVTCGDWTTGGKGRLAEPPGRPTVTVDGKLDACAKILAKNWKRPVRVSTSAGRRTIRKRTLRGTPEQIAEALGLEIGRGR